MTKTKVENAKPNTDNEQGELPGSNDERPAIAGLRFSLAEAAATLKGLTVLGKLQDDEGPLLRVKLQLHVALGDTEVDMLPEISDAVDALMSVGVDLPSKAKNQFSLSLGREFAGAKYTISGTPGRVSFNGQVDGNPSVKVVKGKASLVLRLIGVVRDGDFKALTAYLNDKPKLTVEPPQQELDFAEAS